jgi:hypothetical protein
VRRWEGGRVGDEERALLRGGMEDKGEGRVQFNIGKRDNTDNGGRESKPVQSASKERAVPVNPVHPVSVPAGRSRPSNDFIRRENVSGGGILSQGVSRAGSVGVEGRVTVGGMQSRPMTGTASIQANPSACTGGGMSSTHKQGKGGVGASGSGGRDGVQTVMLGNKATKIGKVGREGSEGKQVKVIPPGILGRYLQTKVKEKEKEKEKVKESTGKKLSRNTTQGKILPPPLTIGHPLSDRVPMPLETRPTLIPVDSHPRRVVDLMLYRLSRNASREEGEEKLSSSQPLDVTGPAPRPSSSVFFAQEHYKSSSVDGQARAHPQSVYPSRDSSLYSHSSQVNRSRQPCQPRGKR